MEHLVPTKAVLGQIPVVGRFCNAQVILRGRLDLSFMVATPIHSTYSPCCGESRHYEVAVVGKVSPIGQVEEVFAIALTCPCHYEPDEEVDDQGPPIQDVD